MRIVSFAPLVAALLSTPAFAADDDQEGLAVIVTAPAASDEAEQTARKTAGGTDIVRYEDFADKSLVSLRDTLAFSPGVYTQPRFGQEVRISIRGSGLSRGFHMRGLTLLQDGVPINLADDNGDFQELEPIFFDHLEVYRGANALRFGSGTLGGAINGVTPRGRDAPGLYVRADVGSFDMMRGLVSYGGASGPADYWMGLSADNGDGDRDHAKRNSIRFNGNIGLQFSDVASTRFYASYNHIVQELPGALSKTDVLSAPSTGSFLGDQHRNINSLRLQNRTHFDWGSTTFDVGAFLNAKDLFHPIFQVIDQKSLDIGSFARLEHQAGPVAFTLGGEIRSGSIRARQFVNVSGKRGALVFDADQDARTANVYGEARVTPLAGLTLIAGGIYADGFRKRRVNFSTTPTQDGRIAFDEFSPKFGLLYEPTPDIQLFANYSRSAEFPGFGEVFQSVTSGTPPRTVSTFIGDIAPQTAWTAEIGTRGKAGVISWDIAAYRATLDGEMLQYTTSFSIPATTFNADKTRHSGIEAAVSVEPAPWLRLRQVWNWSDFTFVHDAQFGDNRLPVIPTHALRSEIRIGTEALHVAPNLEWVPKGAYVDYSNTTRTSGYALVGVTAGATVRSGIDLFLDVRNLTNKKAIGDISAVLTATPTSVVYYPVERRAVYGGVRARF